MNALQRDDTRPLLREKQETDLREVITQNRIVVCTGSGGVGKTTIAAVIALEGARLGLKTVVVTIDPAKRLANAMGIEGLTNSPSRVLGDWDGELWALMLDTKSTFDSLVVKHSVDPEQADRILNNRFYRNISGALSGTQEYMAMEKLYELHEEGDFELIVVDTPPTRNALDFLEAPKRLTRFLDHRLYRILMSPTRGFVKAVNVAAQAFLRTISKVVGGEVVHDAITFFTEFDGMERGFRDRAAHVVKLLTSEETAFVLVAAPRRDVVEEATYFATKLNEADIPVRALIVNRMHPNFSNASPQTVRERAKTLAGTDLGGLYSNLADFLTVADNEEAHLAGLAESVSPAPVLRIPFLRSDVHDLNGLAEISRHLFPPRRR